MKSDEKINERKIKYTTCTAILKLERARETAWQVHRPFQVAKKNNEVL